MHMPSWLRRLAARFFAIGLLAATLFTVDSLASPSPAEARCTGVNRPVRSTFSPGGLLAASETPEFGTCNGNQTYTATIRDEDLDGFCVEVQFKETGIGWTTPAYGWACGYGSVSRFSWRDVNSNSYSYQRFCIWQQDTGATYCGWGTAYVQGRGDSPYGVNSGY
jgi:hypothetical protein